MQKTKRKKNRHKTKITPSEVQKSLKNLRKINKNQKITYSKFDPIWPPKTTQNRTPKRPKNEPKKITKKERKKERKKKPTCLKNDPNMAPQNDKKTNKKTTRKKNQKKNQHKRKNLAMTPSPKKQICQFSPPPPPSSSAQAEWNATLSRFSQARSRFPSSAGPLGLWACGIALSSTGLFPLTLPSSLWF